MSSGCEPCSSSHRVRAFIVPLIAPVFGWGAASFCGSKLQVSDGFFGLARLLAMRAMVILLRGISGRSISGSSRNASRSSIK